jgi:hypothetical protein
MKKKMIILALLACLFTLQTACRPEDDPAPYQSNPILENVDTAPRTLTGKTTGTASAIYSVSGNNVTCVDQAASYEMMLSKNGAIPDGSSLSGPLPKNAQYFSIDISAVMRILENGACLERDPSDDRTHLKIEGYYEGATYKFTPVTCSQSSTITNSEIYYTTEYVTTGSIECVYSDQMKYTFQFSDLKLR